MRQQWCESVGAASPHNFSPPLCQGGHVDLVTLLLRHGANVRATFKHFGTARDFADFHEKDDVVNVIDSHVLRCQLIDMCCALHAAQLPVLVLSECVAWSAATTRANESAALPLDEQWRIAKHIREWQALEIEPSNN